MIADLTRVILGLHGWAALAVIFGVPLAESSVFLGFIFPGEIAIMLGGVLASQHRLPLAAAMGAGVAGAILGDTIGYAVGHRYGRRLLHGSIGRIAGHRHLDRAETYLARRGGKAVFFGRFTATLRALIPGLAGMAHMPYRTFALFNITGGLLWAVETILVGYLAGANWKNALHLGGRIGLLVFALLLAAAGIAVTIRSVRRRTGRFRAFADRLAGTRPAVWAGDRFPRQLAWAHRRLDPATPTGLPLTCMVTTATVSGWMFAGLTEDIVAHDPITRRDLHVHAYLLTHRTPWLTHAMEAVTWLGSTLILIPLLAAASVYLLRTRRDVHTTVYLWVGLGGAVILSETFKSVAGRARPPAAQMIVSAGGHAYPSGHATQAIVVWGLLAFLLTTGRPRPARRTRALIPAAAATVILLVGASRLYLGVPWLTDVLAGYALGFTWLALLLTHRLRHTTASRKQRTGPAPWRTGLPRRQA